MATEADLADVALNTGDLPGDWSASGVVDLGADREDSICNNPGPDTMIEPIARAEVQFQQSDFGPFILENISAYRSWADGVRMMNYLRWAISCSEWDDNINNRDWDVAPLPFPEKGENTLAFELRTSLGFIGTVRFHGVFVQVDNIVVLVAHGALGDVDINDTERYVDLALEKLERLP